MDLKNKLSEEEAREFAKILIPRLTCDTCVDEKIRCIDCIVEILKQSGIIRKSAREELDKFIDSMIWGNEHTSTTLKQLIDAALKEAAERAKEGRNEIIL